jgi:hypothetical protein
MNEDEMSGTYSTHGGDRNVLRIFVGKPEGKIPLERPRSRWANNTEMENIVWGAEWIHLAQDMDR